MDIVRSQLGGKVVFALCGRLDTQTAPDFQAVLIPEFDTADEIELDLAGLSYVSSAGLRVLLLGQKTAKTKGAAMVIVNVKPEVMEIFDVTGFSDVLKIVS